MFASHLCAVLLRFFFLHTKPSSDCSSEALQPVGAALRESLEVSI